jgi:hypothetical protein
VGYIREKSRSNFIRCWPPSTSSVVPVMDWLSSANFTVAATSAGWTSAPAGRVCAALQIFRRCQQVAGQRQAGGHAHHANLRCQRHRQHGVGGFQRGFGQGVAEKIGVLVPQLLVQQVHHHAQRTTFRASSVPWSRRHMRVQRPAPEESRPRCCRASACPWRQK